MRDLNMLKCAKMRDLNGLKYPRMSDLKGLRYAKLLTYLQIPFCPLTVYGITVPTTCHKNASVL